MGNCLAKSRKLHAEAVIQTNRIAQGYLRLKSNGQQLTSLQKRFNVIRPSLKSIHYHAVSRQLRNLQLITTCAQTHLDKVDSFYRKNKKAKSISTQIMCSDSQTAASRITKIRDFSASISRLSSPASRTSHSLSNASSRLSWRTR